MSLKLVAGLACSLAVAGGAFLGGMRYGAQTARADQAEQRARQAEETLARVRDLASTADAISAAYQRDAVQIRTVTRERLIEVPYALPPDVDARFPIPNGLVRLHDQAATGAVLPEPAGEPDGAASAVTTSALASVVITNYEACRLDQDRLAALQDFNRSLATEPPP